jgi:uncharacterized protein
VRRLTLLLISLLGLTSGTALRAHQTHAGEFFDPGPPRSLAEAAADGRTNKLEALVAAGADVNAQGIEGMTALLWALSRLSKDGVAWLLQHHADPNVIFARDGKSAISFAAGLEDQWFLREVLAHGGDVNVRNPLSGRTPLAEAMASGRDDNARLLVAAGADMNILDSHGMTPLIEAAASQKYELVYEMLIAGADPRVQLPQSRGKTLLSVIRRSQVPQDSPQYQWQMKVIELLKQKGLDVERGQ